MPVSICSYLSKKKKDWIIKFRGVKWYKGKEIEGEGSFGYNTRPEVG